ncbi:short-chain dehydrogenase, partial [bacterium SM23_31]
MKSLWNDEEAKKIAHDPLQMRVYTSRLIGREPSLVLHGGGNTSVKAEVTNVFGETEEVLYIKGSGWDLTTIEAEGFSPVRLDALKKMAQLDELSDTDMVRAQRVAMTDPEAPNPSVEAILHAIIPFKFVDHTHADAVVAISNTEGGEERIYSIYGDSVIVVPYIKAGFILAKKIFEMTRNIDWSRYEGIVLLNHGIFSFHDEAQTSYERMINLVSKAEEYLEQRGAFRSVAVESRPAPAAPLLKIAQLRKEVSSAAGTAMLARLNSSEEARGFANLPDVESIVTRGPLTPDHVFRAKHIPMVISRDIPGVVKNFVDEYRK